MNKGHYYFRIVLGVYITYLGYGLVKDSMADRPENYMLFAVVGTVFMILGIVCAVGSLKKASKQEDVKPNETDSIEEIDSGKEE